MSESKTVIDKFVQHFEQFHGKAFEVVSGRNSYTFNKTRHTELVKADGIYLLLENAPMSNLKYRYDKALFVPARVIDRMLPTNDPAAVKKSFSMPSDTIRLNFYQQTHKLHQASPCIIKVVEFDDTRRAFRVDKKDFMSIHHVRPNEGSYFVFICTAMKEGLHRFIQVNVVSTEDLVEKFGRTSSKLQNELIKSTDVHLELTAISIAMLDRLDLRKLLTKEPVRIANESKEKQKPVKHYPFTAKCKYDENKQSNVGIDQTKTSKQKTLGEIQTLGKAVKEAHLEPGKVLTLNLSLSDYDIVIECIVKSCTLIEKKKEGSK